MFQCVTVTAHGTTAIFTGKYTGATLQKVYVFHCTKRLDAI